RAREALRCARRRPRLWTRQRSNTPLRRERSRRRRRSREHTARYSYLRRGSARPVWLAAAARLKGHEGSADRSELDLRRRLNRSDREDEHRTLKYPQTWRDPELPLASSCRQPRGKPQQARDARTTYSAGPQAVPATSPALSVARAALLSGTLPVLRPPVHRWPLARAPFRKCALHLQHVEERVEPAGLLPHACREVAHFRDPVAHGEQREVARLDVRHFVPAQWR